MRLPPWATTALLYQGLFLAPHTVAQAVKTAVFNARMMELLGYQTEPRSDQERHDIIQMVSLEQPESWWSNSARASSPAPLWTAT